MARINAINRALRSVRNEPEVDMSDIFTIDQPTDPNAEAAKDALLIRWDAIARNESQPRQSFDEAALQELADSIQQDGQLQPILVRPHPSEADRYQIVMGERRWRACGPGYADLPFVRAVVRRNVSDEDAFRLALIENVMREDLNDVDKAKGLVALKESMRKSNPRVTWEEVGATLGYSRVHISRLISMLRLPTDIQASIQQNVVSTRQARVLAKERDPDRRSQLFEQAKAGVSSDELEKQVSKPFSPSPPSSAPSSSSPSSAAISTTPSGAKPKDKANRGEQLLNIRRAIAWANELQSLQDWPESERAALLEALKEAARAYYKAHRRLG